MGDVAARGDVRERVAVLVHVDGDRRPPPQLRDELALDGTLLASGIFVDREAEVVAAFEAAGLAIAGRDAEGDWVALEARRAEPA